MPIDVRFWDDLEPTPVLPAAILPRLRISHQDTSRRSPDDLESPCRWRLDAASAGCYWPERRTAPGVPAPPFFSRLKIVRGSLGTEPAGGTPFGLGGVAGSRGEDWRPSSYELSAAAIAKPVASTTRAARQRQVFHQSIHRVGVLGAAVLERVREREVDHRLLEDVLIPDPRSAL
jgi:hypothetical protein